MATYALPPITPAPGTLQTIDSPWQGQGVDVWRALVRNLSPYPLMIGVSTSTYWLAPYEQDFYEFPAGVYSFSIIPQEAIVTTAGGSQVGTILVVAFDQSSNYDGVFPSPLSSPDLQQTFALLGSGTYNFGDPNPTGTQGQPFDAIVAYVELLSLEQGGDAPPFSSPAMFLLTSTTPVVNAAAQDCKGSFAAGANLILACSGPGPVWNLSGIVADSGECSYNYSVYGVTIGDPIGLLGPPQGATGPANPGIATEPYFWQPTLIGSVGTQLAIEGSYTGPGHLTISVCDGQYPFFSTTTFVLIDDPTNSEDNTVNFSFQRPAHEAWVLLATSDPTPGTTFWQMNVRVLP
jgi:hypothetical protein